MENILFQYDPFYETHVYQYGTHGSETDFSKKFKLCQRTKKLILTEAYKLLLE